jgi:hypothetical protein
MMRSYLILNIKSMNDLPLMERWLLQTHAAETLSQNEMWLYRYVSYRVVPAPDGAEPYGCYNWRMTEHWWREVPWVKGQMDHGSALAEQWPKDYNEILGLPKGGPARTAAWGGKPEGPHPPVFCFVPARPTEDFKGKGLTLADGTILRWVVALKYPEGVSAEEGDDWYLNIHAKEVCKQPGLKRFFSHKVCDPKIGPWVRISEQWYENADAWSKAIIEQPPKYSRPPWGGHAKYPFLEPYVDFVSQFLLEAPTNDFKRNLSPYLVTS